MHSASIAKSGHPLRAADPLEDAPSGARRCIADRGVKRTRGHETSLVPVSFT
jgi:hypothetical protein